jgi:hypothetical protein
MEVNKIKLSHDQLTSIFQELRLYYPNNPYKDYNANELKVILKMYYESLKYYDESIIRKRMTKYVEKEKFFPQICDLIPQESDFRGY